MQQNSGSLANAARRWTVGIFGLVFLSGCGALPGNPAATAPPARDAKPPSSLIAAALPAPLTNLWMSTPQDGVGIGPQGMYTTMDGARHWTPAALPGPSPATLATGLPSGISTTNLVAVGIAPGGIVWTVKQIPSLAEIAVYWTSNRGSTWLGGALSIHQFSQGAPLWIDSVSFLGSHRAWLSIQPQHGMNSEPGDLWYTNTGGKTWSRIASTTPGTGSGTLPVGGEVSFITNAKGWDVGPRVATTPNLVWTTQDGAKRWTQVSLPGYPLSRLSVLTPPRFFGQQGVLPVQYVPTSHKTVDFATILYHSANGGQTWVPSTPMPGSPTPTIDSISASTTWIWTGYQNNSYPGSSVHGSLEVTTDGGARWSQRPPTGILQSLMAQGYSITHLDFINSQQGWATTQKLDTRQDGPLLETRNGGGSWRRLGPIVAPSS